jgi:hypothetical protein
MILGAKAPFVGFARGATCGFPALITEPTCCPICAIAAPFAGTADALSDVTDRIPAAATIAKTKLLILSSSRLTFSECSPAEDTNAAFEIAVLRHMPLATL